MRELALHILDLLQNAAEAGATRVRLAVEEESQEDLLRITVSDNGRGMDAETAAHVLDPFFTSRTTRHVGLGLPLVAAAAERAGGSLALQSEAGRGTTVVATFRLRHPDRQPMGDLAGTLMAFLLSASSPALVYSHRVGSNSFDLDTDEIAAALDGLPLSHPAIRHWLREYLEEGEASLISQA